MSTAAVDDYAGIRIAAAALECARERHPCETVISSHEYRCRCGAITVSCVIEGGWVAVAAGIGDHCFGPYELPAQALAALREAGLA